MADVSKIKLPNNTEVNIKDSRITGVDSTPTSESGNVITSGGVHTALAGKQATLVSGTNIKTVDGQSLLGSGNVVVSKLGTATKGSSTMPIYLNSGTPTAISSFKEAYLSWGGKNFSANYGPIDAAMIDNLGACRTMFAKAEGIVIEYSRDAGQTWTDYGATDSQKVSLFSGGSSVFTIGKNSVASESSIDHMLRVTLNTSAAGVYTTLNKFVIFITTYGSTGCYCTIRARLQQNYEDNVDTWVTRADQVPISGWSGYNVINITGTSTYGNTKSSQYGQIQFIFGCTGCSTNYTGLRVQQIYSYGGVGWTTPSNMAKSGHLYSWDYAQNATFPGEITATAIKKKNGTSSQFLKADGSVDANGYLPLNGGTLSGDLTIGSDSKLKTNFIQDNRLSTTVYNGNPSTGVQQFGSALNNYTFIASGTDPKCGSSSDPKTILHEGNVKTVNGTSILGSGDIAVQSTLVSGTNIKTINGNSVLGSGNMNIEPSQVFIAEYNETSYADCSDAYYDGKIIFCRWMSGSDLYMLPCTYLSDTDIDPYIIFEGIIEGDYTSIVLVYRTTGAQGEEGDYWTKRVEGGIETTDNKVTSISSSSTDSQYPTAKAVYDFVDDTVEQIPQILSGTADPSSSLGKNGDLYIKISS